MTWTIQYSDDAQRFIQQEDIHDEITSQLRKVLIKLSGKPTNVDLKKLIGDWYYPTWLITTAICNKIRIKI